MERIHQTGSTLIIVCLLPYTKLLRKFFATAGFTIGIASSFFFRFVSSYTGVGHFYATVVAFCWRREENIF